MNLSPRLARALPAACLLGCLVLAYGLPQPTPPGAQTLVMAAGKAPQGFDGTITETAQADQLIRHQPGFFVPNLGQWDHAARFVHRSGPMTLFLEDRGWVIDLLEHLAGRKAGPNAPGPHAARPYEPGAAAAHQAVPGKGGVDQKIRGAALQMTFEGDGRVPEIVGEKKLNGHHNYFLGNDENRWRTGVPLYASVCFKNLYPGIDLRLRQVNGVPEYDLLLQPGADLSCVTVHVEGADALRISKNGSLVIDTPLGPLTQPLPKTWKLGGDGKKRQVVCNFVLLGVDRFGFEAPGWDGDTTLTIDPGLIWSTFVGGSWQDYADALSLDAHGVVTVVGGTASAEYPTTSGAYDTTYNGISLLDGDVFVSRLDTTKTGTAQLIYSTFLGGDAWDSASTFSIDASGVVTLTGSTSSKDFPTTKGAYDTTHNGPTSAPGFHGGDVFVSRLDPSQTGTAQLVYSSFLGGSGYDHAQAISLDASGVVTVAGYTLSVNFPTTSGAYDTTFNDPTGQFYGDVIVSRLDPGKAGSAQLVYSTFLGGNSHEQALALSADTSGVVTVAGFTGTSSFPTTGGAYDTTFGGGIWDAFVSCLDLSKTGSAQLVYSTFLGGSGIDTARVLSVDASSVVTVAGETESSDYPATTGAYDTTYSVGSDVFVSRLDPSKTGSAQLVYSTFLGGAGNDRAFALYIDASDLVTMAGGTSSTNFPTTSGAYDTTHNSSQGTYFYDVFVSRLDLSKSGIAQLVYSTFLGGDSDDSAHALCVDTSGVVTVAGRTWSSNFPTTSGAYDTTYNGGTCDVFASRLSMGVAFYSDRHELSMSQPGTQQKLTLNAGKTHAGKSYWIFGSMTGTAPGVILNGVHMPLKPDLYTDVTITFPNQVIQNAVVLQNFKGTLDSDGRASAAFNLPSGMPPIPFTLYHAYLVYDRQGTWHMASNAVPRRLAN